MVKYYIKITDEKPLDEDSALWFELESDENTGKADFFVLDRNEYTALVRKFEGVQQSYDRVSAKFTDSVIEEVTPTIESYIASLPSTVDGAYSLVDSENSENTYDYSSLSGILEDIETDYNTKIATKLNTSSVDSALSDSSINPVQNKVIKKALDNKANTSSLTSLQTTINGKANVSHTHNGWSYLRLNDYSGIYYNSAIKMCHFRYYRSSYNFTKTDSFTLHSKLIPSAYLPNGGDVVLPFYHSHLIGYIDDTTGNFQIKSDTKTSYTINTSAMWSYK